MSGERDITYSFDLGRQRNVHSSPSQRSDGDVAVGSIPRIARLMALAIRFDGLLRDETIRDYAELARLGGSRVVVQEQSSPRWIVLEVAGSRCVDAGVD